jgi:hypothetical protein
MKKFSLKEILFVFLILGSAYGYFFSQHDSNTNARLALVKAIVEEKRLEIDTFHDGVLDTIDKAYYNGHYYNDKAIGTSLLGVPVYYLILKISILFNHVIKISQFRSLLTLFAISLPNALLATSLYQFVKDATEANSSRFSLLITLAVCLGTPLYLYSSTYYSHSLTGFLLFAVFYFWFSMQQEGNISLMRTGLSGLILGFSIITEYPAAIIVLILGCYILWVMWKQKQLLDKKVILALIAPAFLPLGILAVYNYSIFGNPFALAYMHESAAQFSNTMQTNMGFGLPNLQALFYMTFHTTMGLFWQSPVLLLAFPGWVIMWRSKKYRAEAIFSFITILAFFLILSGYYFWWGGLAFTPRFIIPSLPFFAIPLAFLGQKYYKILFALTLVSIAQMFIVTSTIYYGLYNMLVNVSTDHFYAMFENSTIYSIYWPNFLSGQLVLNKGTSLFGLQGYSSLIPLLFIEVVLLGSFILFTRRPKPIQAEPETPNDTPSSL